jgi:hypothetical protein
MPTRHTAHAAAGYSGTPLQRKLRLQAQMRCWDTDLVGLFDYVLVFVSEAAVLEATFAPTATHVAAGGMLWISWPKKSSHLHGDLTEDGVRAIGLRTEFVDVKVCAIDADSSALKFLRRKPQ